MTIISLPFLHQVSTKLVSNIIALTLTISKKFTCKGRNKCFAYTTTTNKVATEFGYDKDDNSLAFYFVEFKL